MTVRRWQKLGQCAILIWPLVMITGCEEREDTVGEQEIGMAEPGIGTEPEGEAELGQEFVGSDVDVDLEVQPEVEPTVPPPPGNKPDRTAAANTRSMMFPVGGQEGVIRVETNMPEKARVGEAFEMDIRVTNTSDAPVHDVVLKEFLPQGLRIRSAGSEEWQQPVSDDPEFNPEQFQQQRGQQAATRQGQQDQAGQGRQGQQQQRQAQAQQGRQQQQAQGGQQSQTQQRQAQRQQGQDQQGQAQRQQAQQQEQGQQGRSQQRQAQAGQGQQGQRDQQRQANQGGQQQESKTWRLGTLEPGETKTIQLTASARSEGRMQSCLAVSAKPTLCAELVAVKPELEFQRQVLYEGEPASAFYVCDDITVRYLLTNTGSGTTSPAIITEQLPDHIRSERGNKIELEVGPVPAGETIERTVMVQAQDPRQWSGYATAKTKELAVESEEKTVQIVRPELALQVDGPDQEFLGRTIRYNVRLTNNSEVPAINTAVRVTLPEGARDVSVSTQRFEREGELYRIGVIDPGATEEIAIAFNAPVAAELTAQVEANAYCVSAIEKEIQTVVKGVPAARLEVVDLTDPVNVGGTTTYEIQVKNQGSAEDVNVRLSAQLPDEFEFLEADGQTNVQSDGQTLQFDPIASLPPGEVVSWLVSVRARDAGQVRFKLNMQSDYLQQEMIEMEPTTIY